MKTKLLLIGLLIWNLNSVFAQICGTLQPTNPTVYPEEEKNFQKKGSSSAICINVFFHIVRNTNETNAFTMPNTNDITEELNEFYSPHNIIFNNLGSDFINNSNYVDLTINEAENLTVQKINPSNKANSKKTANSNSSVLFKIFDFNSNLIFKGFIDNQITIDVSNYKRGNYILKIYKNGKSESHQIIIN